MNVSESITLGAVGLGASTVALGGIGVAAGLAAGAVGSLHEPKDGTADAGYPFKVAAAGVGALALGSTLLTVAGALGGRGGALGALRGCSTVIGTAAFLGGGFTTMLGGVGTGIALAD